MTIYANPQAQELTFTTTLVTVGTVDTLVLAANPKRRYLLIQRGTTIGRVFMKLSAGAATVTNGLLMRENAYFEREYPYIYTGEVRAITVDSSKLLYVTEGVIA